MKYKKQIMSLKKCYEKNRTPLLLASVTTSLLIVITLAVAPGEYVYKSEITQKYIRTNQLEERIEIWEERIADAQKEILENNRRITLLSEVFNSNK